MTDDLLARIQREMHERLQELRGAVDEHDRLAANLEALEAAPGQPVDPEARVDPDPPESPADPESLVATEAPVALEPPPANVVRLPVRPTLPRTRTVSPKVARLMHAPRRPALERSGVVRVGAAHGERVDLAPDEPVDEIDAEAEVYERAVSRG
jgi:hypothetical protein